MSIGGSIFLIAVGAVLKYAVTGHVHGVRLQVVGLILMLVGVLGLVVSLLYAAIYNRRRRPPDDAVVTRRIDR